MEDCEGNFFTGILLINNAFTIVFGLLVDLSWVRTSATRASQKFTTFIKIGNGSAAFFARKVH
jgi:hypothetical protein